MTFDYGSFTGRNLGFVDESEQQLLREASVFVCGVGGMGGAAFMALARAGIGKFVIADIDRFEVSNLNRQVFAFNDAVGREKVKEYANAVGETNPFHLDPAAARAAGYADVVAPPMFAVVYSGPAMGPVMFDPEVGMNFATMVHGGQTFEWDEPACSGDEITTTASVKDISERSGTGFYVFESVSTNQDGHTVCVGTWTNVVRGG